AEGGTQTRYFGFDIATYALGHAPRWVVLDGHVDERTGALTPRLGIGTWLMRNPAWSQYRRVYSAVVYEGSELGLGADRVDLVYERTE
ncbi:MAG: hypothetical protein V3R77_08105, partial [Candidatus Binatia bacterium]